MTPMERALTHARQGLADLQESFDHLEVAGGPVGDIDELRRSINSVDKLVRRWTVERDRWQQ